MSDHNDELQLPSRSLGTVVIESVLGIIFTIAALTGNFLVLLAVYRNPQLRKVHNAYVVCLALSDFFMGLLVFTIIDAIVITGEVPGGKAVCWFHASVTCFCTLVSIYTMAIISVQRYYKVVEPNKHNIFFSYRRVQLTIGLVVLAATVMTVVQALSAHDVHFYQEFANCLLDIDITIMFIMDLPVFILLPFATMFFFYFKIWKFVTNHNLQMSHSNVNADEVKLTKLLCFVLGAFAVSYLPYAITLACLKFNVEPPRQATFFAMVMCGFSSIVNPFIYAAMNREFRNEFVAIVRFRRKTRTSAER